MKRQKHGRVKNEDTQDTAGPSRVDSSLSDSRPHQRKPSALKKAKNEFLAKKEQQQREKLRRQEERQRREEMRRKRDEERKVKQKLLSKKTRRGQPVMSGRIQLLVSKLEAELGYKKT